MQPPSVSRQARTLSTSSLVLLLNRVQIVIAAVVAAVLLDYVIEGTMREAMRFMVLDVPHQLVTTAFCLFLACVALRLTGLAMIALIAPDIYSSNGLAGHLTRSLPRLYPIVLGLVTAIPVLNLAYENRFLGGVSLGEGANAHLPLLTNTQLSLAAGLCFVLIGAFVALYDRLSDMESSGESENLGQPALLAVVGLTSWILLFGLSVAVMWAMVPQCAEWAACWRNLGAFGRYAGNGLLYLVLDVIVFSFASYSVIVCGQISVNIVGSLFSQNQNFNKNTYMLVPIVIMFVIGINISLNLVNTKHDYIINPYWEKFHGSYTYYFQYAIAALFAGTTLSIGFVETRRILFAHSVLKITAELTEKTWAGLAELGKLGVVWAASYLLVFAVSVLLSLAFFDLSNTWLPAQLGSVAIILTWAAALVVFSFPFAYLSHWTRLPFLTTAILAAVVFSALNLNDNHSVRFVPPLLGEKTASEQLQQAVHQPGRSRFGEQLDFTAWLRSRPDLYEYDHYPVFVIATEGGGIRAAYFTASVLAALQDVCPTFAQHVYAISGVSGGSVGAAAFSALSADFAKASQHQRCHLDGSAPNEFRENLRKVLASDLLSPLFAGMLFPDALQRILPFPEPHFDRARSLEFALENAWAERCKGCDVDRMRNPMDDLFSNKETNVAVPHLILNTTQVETGKAAYVSTARPINYASIIANQAGSESAFFDPGIQTFQTQDKRLALSTAAMLSARFPILSPAARHDDNRYVDGGYFENSGGWMVDGLAQSMLEQKFTYGAIPGNQSLAEARAKAQIIAITLRSTPQCIPSKAGECPKISDRAGGVSEILSPIRTLLNTRSARAGYSKATLAATAAVADVICTSHDYVSIRSTAPTLGEFACRGGPGYLVGRRGPGDEERGSRYPLSVIELGFDAVATEEVPLTWLLSSRARKPIDEAIDDMVRDDITPLRQSSTIVTPSEKRMNTASTEGKSAISGPVEVILCALSAKKNGTNYPEQHICNDL